jgi:hypothetical protein
MSLVNAPKRRGTPRKGSNPKVKPSPGSESHHIGALPASEGSEVKGMAETKVTMPAKSEDEAPADKVGYYIGAVTPMEDVEEIAAVPKTKISKSRTKREEPVEKVGYYIGAMTPMEDVKDEEVPKTPKVRKPKAQPKGKRSVSQGKAPPVMEEAPVKSEPIAKAKACDCGYGWVEVQGNRYEFDVVVHVDGSITKRDKGPSKKKKEKYGHTPLTGKELKALKNEEPEMIIIGTGHSGAMPLTPKAEKFLEGYTYFIGKTPEALETLATCGDKAVAVLHVTC